MTGICKLEIGTATEWQSKLKCVWLMSPTSNKNVLCFVVRLIRLILYSLSHTHTHGFSQRIPPHPLTPAHTQAWGWKGVTREPSHSRSNKIVHTRAVKLRWEAFELQVLPWYSLASLSWLIRGARKRRRLNVPPVCHVSNSPELGA